MQLNIQTQGSRTAITLFYFVLAMLIPVILNSLGLLSNFAIAMGMAFVLVCIISFVRLPLFQAKINNSFLFIVAVFFCNSIMAMVINTFNGIEINSFDFINIVAKLINIYILYILPKCMLFSTYALKKYARLMVALAIIACGYNLISNLPILTSGFSSFSSSYEIKLCSFFINRNQFGMFLVVSIFLAELAFMGNNNKYKWIILSILYVNLFLTFSRGSMISVIFFYMLRYILGHNIIQNMTILFKILICVVVFLVIAMVYIPGIIDFLSTMVIRSDVGTSGRTAIWLMGLTIVLHTNVINGLGSFTGIDFAIQQGFEFGQFHSLYIDTLVSGGIIELIILLVIYVTAYIACGKCYDRNIRNNFKAFLVAVLLMGTNESVSFFSLGYVDMFFTVNCITLPLLVSNLSVHKYR